VASDIPTVAANVADITNFADVYQGGKATAPTLRNDGSALQAGDLYFDTVLNEMRVYDGSVWQAAGSTVNGTAIRQTFTATAAQTTFTVTGGYDAGFADVYLNGVKLVNGTDVTVTSGTDVVLTVGAAAGDSVDVIAYGAFVLANHYTLAEADALLAGKVNKAGDTMTGGLTLGGALNLGSTGQIQFPATQNASSNANTLDDYEEGTWTPVLVFGGGNTGMVISIQTASYTKIGRVVHIQFRFAYTTKGSSTGSALLGGLPFPATGNAVNQGYSTGTFTFETNGGTTILAGLFALAWEDGNLYLRANTGTASAFAQLTNSNFGTNSQIWGSVVYRTAS
jgi:hypothetical protein